MDAARLPHEHRRERPADEVIDRSPHKQSAMRDGPAYRYRSRGLREANARMQRRAIPHREGAHGRRRRQQPGIVERARQPGVARRRPFQRPASRDQKTVVVLLHHRAVGKLFDLHRQRMQPLAARKPLPVQHRIDLGRQHVLHTIARFPCRAKAIGVVAPAVEARTMASGKGGRLIQKEQLGPAPSAHHLAPPPAEFRDADQPGRARPTFFQERFGGGVMDDAAIACEETAMRGGDDLSRRGNAVLQGHRVQPSTASFRGGPQDRTRN